MNFSSRVMQSSDWSRLRYFKPTEFHHPESMGFEFVFWLDTLRNRAAVPLVLVSDHRTIAENVATGGAPDSAHCDVPCNAVDIGERPYPADANWNHSRFKIVTIAVAMGCTRIGLYANGSIHLDMTQNRRPGERIWRVVGSIHS